MAGLYSAPLAALIARVQYHAAVSGRLLFGLKVYPFPLATVDGKNDLPSARFYIPELEEKFVHRGLARCRIVAHVNIATRRDAGIIPLIVWAEKLLDSIELSQASPTVKDLRLSGNLRQPITWKVTEPFVHTESINLPIAITMIPMRIAVRGKRRL
jgi:hypothetical protein